MAGQLVVPRGRHSEWSIGDTIFFVDRQGMVSRGVIRWIFQAWGPRTKRYPLRYRVLSDMGVALTVRAHDILQLTEQEECYA